MAKRVEFGEIPLIPLYHIIKDNKGNFFAVRTATPYFCFQGDSIQDVVKAADDALDLYQAWKDNDGA